MPYFQVPGIDLINDLQVARQDSLKHAHRPALQRLGQEGVVSIGKDTSTDVPCFVPAQSLQIQKDAH